MFFCLQVDGPITEGTYTRGGAVYGITTPESINERAHGLHYISMNFRIPPFIMQGLSSDKFHHNLQIIIRTIIRRKRNEDIGRNP